MSVSTILLVIVLTVAGLCFILFTGKKKSGEGQSPDPGDSKSSGSSQTVNPFRQEVSVDSSNLLSQLSKINARDFPALSLNQLPTPIEGFVGRKDILPELTRRLPDTIKILGLYGPHGFGKTALALQIAHKLK